MLIPDNIKDFNSQGEKILYLKFKNDGSTNSMFVLHSLFTNYHIKNISGELDFLVIAPEKGFFSIEVKHGKVTRKNGNWCYTDRNGKVTVKKISPFAQQNATMNSIRRFVLNRIQHNKNLYDRFSKLLWGSGVAFTSMTENIDFGPEGQPWQILTKSGLGLPIRSFIETLSEGSHNENEGKSWYHPHLSKPTKSDCELLLKILRGDFEIDYSEINRILEAETLIEEYTKEQFELLEFTRYNRRCLIQGAAGTGKTIMALELFKRKIYEGLKVGLFCYNRKLGERLKSASKKVYNENNGYCGTLHSYMMKQINTGVESVYSTLSNYYSEYLPIEFLIEKENIKENEMFDFLIIDESQDLLSPYYIEVFDLILNNGLANGKWVMFGDFSNQAIYINDPHKSIELLDNYTQYTKFPPLKINCRNTKEIATQNTLLTGAEVPHFTSRNYSGNHVVCKFPSKGERLNVLHKVLNQIKERGIPLNKITLLSPKKLVNTYASSDLYIDELISNGLNVNSIQAYKGLENTVIILYDFDEVSSLKMQRLLYTGISRAKQELYLVLDKSQEKAVSKLIEQNFPKTQTYGDQK